MLYWMRYSLFLVMATLPGLLWAEPIAVRQVETQLQEDHYLLDAKLHFEFNETVIDALQHGVPLTIELQLQVVREDAWFWEPNVADLKLYRVLRFHALTGLYEIKSLVQGSSQSFAVRDIAISALGEIQSLFIAEKKQLIEGETYVLELRASLDIESLPLTLRPLAYLTADWNLTSDWHIHPLTQLLEYQYVMTPKRFITRILPMTMLLVLLLISLHLMTTAVQNSSELNQLYVPLLLFSIFGLVVLVVMITLQLVKLVRQYRRKKIGVSPHSSHGVVVCAALTDTALSGVLLLSGFFITGY